MEVKGIDESEGTRRRKCWKAHRDVCLDDFQFFVTLRKLHICLQLRIFDVRRMLLLIHNDRCQITPYTPYMQDPCGGRRGGGGEAYCAGFVRSCSCAMQWVVLYRSHQQTMLLPSCTKIPMPSMTVSLHGRCDLALSHLHQMVCAHSYAFSSVNQTTPASQIKSLAFV